MIDDTGAARWLRPIGCGMLPDMRMLGLPVLASVLLIGCVRELPVVVPLPASATPALQEEEIHPVELPHIRIVDLVETPSPDGTYVTLTGSLRNGGEAPTRELFVTVEGRNAADAVVLITNAEASTQQILPGETATFRVTVENRPDISYFRVEAVSR